MYMTVFFPHLSVCIQIVFERPSFPAFLAKRLSPDFRWKASEHFPSFFLLTVTSSTIIIARTHHDY